MKDKAQLWQIAINVWDITANVIMQLKENIDRQAFLNCIEALGKCRGRIIIAGVGTSAAAAKKIVHTLSCIERPAFFLSPGDAVHGALGSVQKGDLAILISKGGRTREIVNLLPPLKTKKVFVIGVTENEDSILARESNLLLKVKVEREADVFNMLATTSASAVIAIFDAICIALMEYTHYTKEQFAVIHPGGEVEEQLLKEKQQKGMRG